MSHFFGIGMRILRNRYLQRLIDSRHNGMIKVVTGVRRCWKSYLLFNLFAEWLIDSGVSDDHLVRIDLEDRHNKTLRNPDAMMD